MKNKTILCGFRLCIFTLLIVVVSGCTTNLGTYDSSLSAENLCYLEFNSTLSVSSFNGTKVKWKPSFLTLWMGGYTNIIIPAGDNSFICDYFLMTQNVNYSAHNLYVSAKMEAGKTYQIIKSRSGGNVLIFLEIREKKR